METEKEIQVAIVPTELGAVQLRQVMADEAERRKAVTEYISKHMVPGTDYGTIKFGGKESKPSLFKPGSEKFLSLFKLTAQFEKDTDTWEMAGSESGVFAFKCQLIASNGKVVGEGRGVSKLSEKQGWTINNAVKIAEKRAQIDAVLRTGALSDFFTQDLEDMAQQTQQYDTSPIEDGAPVTSTGDDTPGIVQKPAVLGGKGNAQTTETRKIREEIMKLLDEKSGEPFLNGADEYKTACKRLTNVDLIPSNYETVLERLRAI